MSAKSWRRGCPGLLPRGRTHADANDHSRP
jgi:hypothetical protein